MNLTELERFELRELLAKEIMRVEAMRNRARAYNLDANVERLRLERVDFLLDIREKLK